MKFKASDSGGATPDGTADFRLSRYFTTASLAAGNGYSPVAGCMRNEIISVNPAFTVITGCLADEVIGRSPKLLSSGTHSPQLHQDMWAQLATTGNWHGEICNRRKSGNLFIEHRRCHLP